MYSSPKTDEAKDNTLEMLFMAARTNKNIDEIEALAGKLNSLATQMEVALNDHPHVLVDSDLSFLGMRSEIAKFKHEAHSLKNVAKLYRGKV